MAPYPSVAHLPWRFRDTTDQNCIGTGTQRNRRSSRLETKEVQPEVRWDNPAFFWAHAVRAPRLWQSSKRLLSRERRSLIGSNAMQKTWVTSKMTKIKATNPTTTKHHRCIRWKGESRPNPLLSAVLLLGVNPEARTKQCFEANYIVNSGHVALQPSLRRANKGFWISLWGGRFPSLSLRARKRLEAWSSSVFWLDPEPVSQKRDISQTFAYAVRHSAWALWHSRLIALPSSRPIWNTYWFCSSGDFASSICLETTVLQQRFRLFDHKLDGEKHIRASFLPHLCCKCLQGELLVHV